MIISRQIDVGILRLALLNNYKYVVPKNKEQLIYDFYAVVNLSSYGGLPGLPEAKRKEERRNYEKLEAIREEIINGMFDYLIPHLKKSLVFAVSAEFRHIYDINSDEKLTNFFEKKNQLPFLSNYTSQYALRTHRYKDIMNLEEVEDAKRFETDKRGYLSSYESVVKSGTPMETFLAIAEEAFVKLAWRDGYAGSSWAEIAKYGRKLFELKPTDSMMYKIALIDHIYHLQHNTDVVFNKIKSYYVNGGYSWLKEGLDFRANLKNFYELIDKCSQGLKEFLYAMIFDIYGTTKQEFDETKEEALAGKENKMTKPNPLTKNIEPEKKEKKENFLENGSWHGGTWKGGIWKKGIWKEGLWEDGTWEGGTWKNGIWKNGIWKKGLWEDGLWESGDWYNGHWEDGIWKGGYWENGSWYGGTWKGGTWLDGFWKDGIWENGVWEGGYIYDPNKKGKYYDSLLDKDGYVWTKYSPKEYFAWSQVETPIQNNTNNNMEDLELSKEEIKEVF